MKVGDLVTWKFFPINIPKENKYGLIIRIDHERSYLRHIGLADKTEYSHQVFVGNNILKWFRPDQLEVITLQDLNKIED